MKLFIPDNGEAGGSGTGSAVADPPSSPTPPTAPVTPEGGQPAPSLIPEPSPPPAPQPGALGDDWINEDGSFREGWYRRFPEEMHVSLARHKNVEGLATEHANAQKLIGRKGVFIPNDKSSSQEVADFRKAVGVPETPEGYQVKPEALPEGMQWSDDIAKPFLAVAHKHNVSQAALRELTTEFAKLESMKGKYAIDMAQANAVQEIREGTTTLQTLWRDNFERNILKAQRAAALVGVDPARKGFRDPEVVAGFVRLADMISEDKLVGATGGLSAVNSGPALASEIQTNPDHPLYKKYQEGDPATVAMVRSYRMQGTKK